MFYDTVGKKKNEYQVSLEEYKWTSLDHVWLKGRFVTVFHSEICMHRSRKATWQELVYFYIRSL